MLKGYAVRPDFCLPEFDLVFYCELNAQERVLMEGGIKEVIHHDDDQVLILDLGQGAAPLESALHTLGRNYVPRCRVQIV